MTSIPIPIKVVKRVGQFTIETYGSSNTLGAVLTDQYSQTPYTLLTAYGSNIGIGTTLPQYNMDVNGTLNCKTLYQNGSELASTSWEQYGSNVVQMNGNVGIGTTSPSYELHVEGKVFATSSITAYSDARVKTNVLTIENALDIVQKMRGVQYDRLDTGDHEIGVIAQEVEQVLPEVVLTGSNGKSVAYGNIVSVLIEAIKDLSSRVATLEQKK
jgi:hypothetical protein